MAAHHACAVDDVLRSSSAGAVRVHKEYLPVSMLDMHHLHPASPGSPGAAMARVCPGVRVAEAEDPNVRRLRSLAVLVGGSRVLELKQPVLRGGKREKRAGARAARPVSASHVQAHASQGTTPADVALSRAGGELVAPGLHKTIPDRREVDSLVQNLGKVGTARRRRGDRAQKRGDVHILLRRPVVPLPAAQAARTTDAAAQDAPPPPTPDPLPAACALTPRGAGGGKRGGVPSLHDTLLQCATSPKHQPHAAGSPPVSPRGDETAGHGDTSARRTVSGGVLGRVVTSILQMRAAAGRGGDGTRPAAPPRGGLLRGAPARCRSPRGHGPGTPAGRLHVSGSGGSPAADSDSPRSPGSPAPADAYSTTLTRRVGGWAAKKLAPGKRQADLRYKMMGVAGLIPAAARDAQPAHDEGVADFMVKNTAASPPRSPVRLAAVALLKSPIIAAAERVLEEARQAHAMSPAAAPVGDAAVDTAQTPPSVMGADTASVPASLSAPVSPAAVDVCPAADAPAVVSSEGSHIDSDSDGDGGSSSATAGAATPDPPTPLPAALGAGDAPPGMGVHDMDIAALAGWSPMAGNSSAPRHRPDADVDADTSMLPGIEDATSTPSASPIPAATPGTDVDSAPGQDLKAAQSVVLSEGVSLPSRGPSFLDAADVTPPPQHRPVSAASTAISWCTSESDAAPGGGGVTLDVASATAVTLTARTTAKRGSITPRLGRRKSTRQQRGGAALRSNSSAGSVSPGAAGGSGKLMTRRQSTAKRRKAAAEEPATATATATATADATPDKRPKRVNSTPAAALQQLIDDAGGDPTEGAGSGPSADAIAKARLRRAVSYTTGSSEHLPVPARAAGLSVEVSSATPGTAVATPEVESYPAPTPLFLGEPEGGAEVEGGELLPSITSPKKRRAGAGRRGTLKEPPPAASDGDDDPFTVGQFTPQLFSPADDPTRGGGMDRSVTRRPSMARANRRQSMGGPAARERRVSAVPVFAAASVRRKSRAASSGGAGGGAPFTLEAMSAWSQPVAIRAVPYALASSDESLLRRFAARYATAEALRLRMEAAVRQEMPTLCRPRDVVPVDELRKPGARRLAVIICVTRTVDPKVRPRPHVAMDALHLATALSRLGYSVELLASEECCGAREEEEEEDGDDSGRGPGVLPPTKDNIIAKLAEARAQERDGLLVCYIGLAPVPSMMTADQTARGFFLTADTLLSPEMTLRADSVCLTRHDLMHKAAPRDLVFCDTVSVFDGDLPEFAFGNDCGGGGNNNSLKSVFPTQDSFSLDAAPERGIVEPGGTLAGRYTDAHGYLATFYFTKGLRGCAVRDRVMTVNSMNVYLSGKLASRGVHVATTASNLANGVSLLAGRAELATPLPYDRKTSSGRKAVARDVLAWVTLDVLVSRYHHPSTVALGKALLRRVGDINHSTTRRGARARQSFAAKSGAKPSDAAAAAVASVGIETEVRGMHVLREACIFIEAPPPPAAGPSAGDAEKASATMLKKLDVEMAMRDVAGGQAAVYQCQTPTKVGERPVGVGVDVQTAVKGAQQKCVVCVKDATPAGAPESVLSKVFEGMDRRVGALFDMRAADVRGGRAGRGATPKSRPHTSPHSRTTSPQGAVMATPPAGLGAAPMPRQPSFIVGQRHAEIDLSVSVAAESPASGASLLGDTLGESMSTSMGSSFRLPGKANRRTVGFGDGVTGGDVPQRPPSPMLSQSLRSPMASAMPSPSHRSASLAVPAMGSDADAHAPLPRGTKLDCRLDGLFKDCPRHTVYDVCERSTIRLRTNDYTAHKLDRACRSGELGGLFKRVLGFGFELGGLDTSGASDVAACFIQQYWRSSNHAAYLRVWMGVQTDEAVRRRAMVDEEMAALRQFKLTECEIRIAHLFSQEEWYRGDKMVWEHEEYDLLRSKFTARMQTIEAMVNSGKALLQDQFD